jgi:hypothetical protein
MWVTSHPHSVTVVRAGGMLEVPLAADAGDGGAADPNRAVAFLADVNATPAAGRCPLTGHIRACGAAGAEQPVRKRRVQTACDRILCCATAFEFLLGTYYTGGTRCTIQTLQTLSVRLLRRQR